MLGLEGDSLLIGNMKIPEEEGKTELWQSLVCILRGCRWLRLTAGQTGCPAHGLDTRYMLQPESVSNHEWMLALLVVGVSLSVIGHHISASRTEACKNKAY